MDSFNTNRKDTVIPGDIVVIDECMAPSTAITTKFKVDGQPAKMLIRRKPIGEGTEIKSAVDGESSIMIALEVQEGAKRMVDKKYNKQFGNSTGVCLRLLENWRGSARVVVGDSAFGSVKTLMAMDEVLKLFFMGAVKTCYSGFPKQFLTDWHSDLVLRGPNSVRGCHTLLSSKYSIKHHATGQEIEKEMLAVGWGELVCKNFITNVGTSILAHPSKRVRHRVITNAATGEPETQIYYKNIMRPVFVEMFFRYFSRIDVHNHLRQGTLAFHTWWPTHTWWHRLLSTYFGITVVDGYYMYQLEYKQHHDPDDEAVMAKMMDFPKFIDVLAYQQVHNTIDGIAAAAPRPAPRAPRADPLANPEGLSVSLSVGVS
jgi:Transposase IS4